MSKRKRDQYIQETHPIIKQIKYEHHEESRKRVRTDNSSSQATKRIATEKDYYIKKLERCLVQLYKKYKEIEYTLEVERNNNVCKLKPLYVH